MRDLIKVGAYIHCVSGEDGSPKSVTADTEELRKKLGWRYKRTMKKIQRLTGQFNRIDVCKSSKISSSAPPTV